MDVPDSTTPQDVDSATYLYSVTDTETVHVGVVLALFAVMAVMSNVVVLGILLQKKHRREAANLYLVNLAIGRSVKKHALVVIMCTLIVLSTLFL